MGYVILQGGNIVGTGVYTKAEVREIERNGFQLVTVNDYIRHKGN